jgi:HEAT repeat protein
MTKTLDTLIADLANPDRQLRMEAIWTLKKFGEVARPAVPALKVIMADTSEPYLQIMAAGTISRIASEDPSPTPVLVQGLKDTVSLHRVAAIEFLGERRSKNAVLNAMTLLSDDDFLVRFATGKAIGKVVGDYFHAVAICVAMLKDDSETNRAMGAECLLSIRRYVGDHLDLLTMAMADCSWQARIDIEQVLAELRRSIGSEP